MTCLPTPGIVAAAVAATAAATAAAAHGQSTIKSGTAVISSRYRQYLVTCIILPGVAASCMIPGIYVLVVLRRSFSNGKLELDLQQQR